MMMIPGRGPAAAARARRRTGPLPPLNPKPRLPAGGESESARIRMAARGLSFLSRIPRAAGAGVGPGPPAPARTATDRGTARVTVTVVTIMLSLPVNRRLAV